MSADLEILSGDVPAGFRQSPSSGLVVPEAQSRKRQVWIRDEWKLLDRVTKMCAERKVALFLGCPNKACKGQPIERIRQADGSIVLRCGCTDRVLQKAF